MAFVRLSTTPATISGAFLSILYDIGGRNPDPLPARVIETTRTAEVLAEIERMKAEGEALPAKPGFVISARVISGRAPSGFKDATRRYVTVNLES